MAVNRVREFKGGGAFHEEFHGEILGSLATTTMVPCLQAGQRERSMPVSSSSSWAWGQTFDYLT